MKYSNSTDMIFKTSITDNTWKHPSLSWHSTSIYGIGIKMTISDVNLPHWWHHLLLTWHSNSIHDIGLKMSIRDVNSLHWWHYLLLTWHSNCPWHRTKNVHQWQYFITYYQCGILNFHHWHFNFIHDIFKLPSLTRHTNFQHWHNI